MTGRPRAFWWLFVVAIAVQATLALGLAIAMGWPPPEAMSLGRGP